eukprot:6708452-Pyramimonas_sp.AAC.1
MTPEVVRKVFSISRAIHVMKPDRAPPAIIRSVGDADVEKKWRTFCVTGTMALFAQFEDVCEEVKGGASRCCSQDAIEHLLTLFDTFCEIAQFTDAFKVLVGPLNAKADRFIDKPLIDAVI